MNIGFGYIPNHFLIVFLKNNKKLGYFIGQRRLIFRSKQISFEKKKLFKILLKLFTTFLFYYYQEIKINLSNL